jgi:hypothetical protein
MTSFLSSNPNPALGSPLVTTDEMPLLPQIFQRSPDRPEIEIPCHSEVLEGTQYVPRGKKRKVVGYPRLAQIEASANQQSQCSFFRLLPNEIRQMVYRELWVDAGLVQHIYIQRGAYTHRKCLIDHRGPDQRQAELQYLWDEEWKVDSSSCENPIWRRRLVSQWCNHWRCEEAAAMHPTATDVAPSPFMPMLLACRQT